MNYFKNCASLDEAKALFKKLAFELHPDKGGSKEVFQEMLNQFHSFRPGQEKFYGEFSFWNSDEYATIIEQLMGIPMIEIEVCGSWIWVSKSTKEVKDQIKAVDCGESFRRGWSKDKSRWYFSPKSYRKKSKNTLARIGWFRPFFSRARPSLLS